MRGRKLIGAVVVGVVFGIGVLVFSSTRDTHTGVGAGGFAVTLLGMQMAAALVVVGLIACVFRGSRREGGLLLACGAAMLAVLLLDLLAIVY